MKQIVLLALLFISLNTRAQKTKEEQQTIAAGETFLMANKKKPGILTTASGLQYKKLITGKGSLPTNGQRIKVNYEGRLLNGTVFDASGIHGGPMELPLDDLMPGWIEGVKLMPAGSKYTFYIPGHLAFAGDALSNKLKPWETVIFDIELLEIVGVANTGNQVKNDAGVFEQIGPLLNPLVKFLSRATIKTDHTDMNTIDPSYIKYVDNKYPYVISEVFLYPDSVFVSGRDIIKGELVEIQFVSGGKDKTKSGGYGAASSVLSYYSGKKTDTLTMFTIGKQKLIYDLKYLTLPVTRVSDLKKMPFKDRLLLLAFSAKFDFANILTEEDVNLISEGSFDNGLLIDGKDEERKRAYLNEAGTLTQNLMPGSDDKAKALKIAQEYSKKIAGALQGIPVIITKCDNKNGTPCEFDDVVYKESYTLLSDTKVEQFKPEKGHSDKVVFQIEVQVYIDGGHRPEIRISKTD